MNSKVQFNLQSLGEHNTGYRAENIKFVSTDENFKRSPHLFMLIFIPSWKCTAMQSNASLLSIRCYRFSYFCNCGSQPFHSREPNPDLQFC